MAVQSGWIWTCVIVSLTLSPVLCNTRELMENEIDPDTVTIEAKDISNHFDAGSAVENCNNKNVDDSCDVGAVDQGDGTFAAVLTMTLLKTACISKVVSFDDEPGKFIATWTCNKDGCTECDGKPSNQCDQVTVTVTNEGGDELAVRDDCVNGKQIKLSRYGNTNVILFHDLAVVESPEPKPEPDTDPKDDDEARDDDEAKDKDDNDYSKGTTTMATPALLIATSIWGLIKLS